MNFHPGLLIPDSCCEHLPPSLGYHPRSNHPIKILSIFSGCVDLRDVLRVLTLEPKLDKFICQELSLIRTQIHTASLHQMCHPAECRDLVKLVFSAPACCGCFNTCHF